MDLGQQSNLGSLISAVLVGLLALASNQYLRMDRNTVKSYINGLQLPHAATAGPLDPAAQKEREVSEVAARISRLEGELSILFEKWKQGSIRGNDARMTAIWKETHALQDQLDADDELRQNLPTRAHVDFVWVMFRAAEMNPREFSQTFLSRSEELASHKNDTVACRLPSCVSTTATTAVTLMKRCYPKSLSRSPARIPTTWLVSSCT